MRLDAIFCQSANGVIGKDGGLPWHLPEDLQFFKKITLGSPMIMGRKTWESLPGLLPGRPHFVLTSRSPSEVPKPKKDPHRLFHVFQDLEAMRQALKAYPKAFLIGGSETFERLLPECHGLYLTTLDHEVEGDTFLKPTLLEPFQQLVWEQHFPGYHRSYRSKSRLSGSD